MIVIESEPLLLRRDGETELQYHRRLVYGKLVDKTLADYDYTELSKYVYGKQYAADVARRHMYGSRYTLELLDKERSNNIKSSSIIDDIDQKMIELKKERQKFFDQRREFNKLVSVAGRQEHLYDTLSESASKLNETVGKIYDGSIPKLDISDNEAVLVFADWHYGMVTDNVFNQYNTDICKNRVAQVVNSAKQRLLIHNCKTLHLVILGDLFHGAIHTSARVASEELVCDQIMQVSEILAQSVCELSKYVDDVVVYMTYGNHCRTVQNKKDNIHRDNMERLIPWWLKERVINMGADNISIQNDTDNEFLFINVAGHEICASHGDLDKIQSSPRLLPTLFQKKFRKDIEYILLADKHHRESFEELGVTAQICGALCGSDDYANEKRLYSTPSQLMLIVNTKYGVDAEYKIKV